ANNGTTSQTIDYTVTGAVSSTAYFNRNTRTITLAKGTGISAVSATGGGIKSTSGTTYTIYYGGTVSIDATVNTASNYEWVNWTDTSGGSSFSTTKNYTFNSVTDNYSLTANGEMAKIYMWNATSSDCGTTMWDNRDGTERSYTTAKIGSLCWMTKSLMLGKSTTTALTPSTSNVSSSGYTLPASSTSGFSSYTAQNIYVPATTACSSSRACYGYYTYAAATAGSNPSSGVSSYDICPKGWRLPTQAEFNTLKSSYSTGATLTASPWYGVYSGYYFSGFFYNGGSYGYYWSSTANGSNLAYLLNFSSSSASVGGGSGYKYSGFAVRCVMKNYMQDQTTDTLAALMPSNGSTTTLYDKRDGNSYTIVKIGNLYWMKENLKIMGTVTAALSNFSGSDFNIEGGGSLTSGNTYTAARATLSTNSSYPGAYYNYCAASAGTVCTASNSTNASSDICPSGWRLPTNAEFGTIGTSSGSTTNVSAFGAIYSGYYYNGTLSDTGSYGAWWSSTAYGTTYRYSLDYGSGKLYSGSYYSRQYGNSIRCVKSS
ncbi:hypothetical protein IJJ37_00990, partial [Candidatus Saccharibacteria bacterium]|nr:hypothetical protein [Candidatus Saccharibacteria bacterium]